MRLQAQSSKNRTFLNSECDVIALQDVGEKCEAGADGGGVKGGAQQQQWRINLLEHIETVQEDVIHRMDFIERELDGVPESFFRELDFFYDLVCIMRMLHVYYLNTVCFSVLENWLDCTGELEPPEPLDRLPELKHNIKQLLNEMGKVQQIALTCAT